MLEKTRSSKPSFVAADEVLSVYGGLDPVLFFFCKH